jgi:hypothetical protein
MDNTKLSYSERWQRVVLTVIRDRGRVGCIGYLTGILARLSVDDWDVRRVLEQLEQDRTP